MKNQTTKTAFISIAFCLLAACSGDRWNGGKYEGDITIDGTRPTDSKPEKFSLVTGKTKRTVKMDEGNKYLANCEIPIDDKYTAGITDDARFAFDLDSAVCGGVKVHSGDLTLEGNKGTVSLIGVSPDGRSYTMVISGVKK